MSSSHSTTDQESPFTPTAIAEPHATEVDNNSQGFAQRVGQRQSIAMPDPFELATDNLAGVRLFENRRDRQMAIQFGEGRPEDKPSDAVITTMKQAGYRWNPADRIWSFPVGNESAMSTRIEAKRLYREVCRMIRQEKGIETGPEASR